MIGYISLLLAILLPFACAEKQKKTSQMSEASMLLIEQAGETASSKSALKRTKNTHQQQQAGQGAEDPMKNCCNQCIEAAGKDPTGADISMKFCRAYAEVIVNEKPLLSPDCSTFFEKVELRVDDCR